MDWAEQEAETLDAFEFKWNINKKTKIPTAFAKAYPTASFITITPEKFLDFII